MAIRPMHHGDVPGVAAIEQASYSPWSEALVAQELDRPGGVQLVAVDGEIITGWCCAMTGPEAELLKIAVEPSFRHRGIGSALLRRLEDLCRDSGSEMLFLEVRAANAGALGLYKKFGFILAGCRKKYYTDPQDDALILKKSLLNQKSNT
jgi:ribosomal-protein-alanine N-acetyltransferase